MLCNAAVQKYHNFRIQLDFFIFWQNFFLKPRRREASWHQQKVVQNALGTIIFDVWMSFSGVLDTMGSIDSKTVNGMGFLQCLIIGKPILTSTIGIAFWTSSTVHGSWKKSKIKKKIRWGIFRWHQKQRAKYRISLESQNSEACELSLNFGYLCSILPCDDFLCQSITRKHFLIFGSNR